MAFVPVIPIGESIQNENDDVGHRLSFGFFQSFNKIQVRLLII